MACSRGCVDADAVRKMMASRVAFPCAAPPAPPSVARSPPPPPPAPPQPLPVPRLPTPLSRSSLPGGATARAATASAGAPVTDSLVPVLGPRRRHRQSCHRQCRCPGYRLPCCGPQSAAPPGPGHQRRCRCRCPPVTGSLVPVGGASSTGSISASCTGFDGCAQSLPPPCLCAPFNER